MQPRKPGNEPSSQVAPVPASPSPTRPAAATPPAGKPSARANQWRLPLLGGAIVVLLVLGGLTVWAVTGNEPPRLNADTVTLVKFVTTREYAKLPFARQAEYMKVLEDRDDNDELEAAFDDGKLSEHEYRAAILEAWLGQQVKRTEKFHSLAPGAPRERYVRDLVDKKEKKEARQAVKKASGKGDGKPDIKRDAALEEIRIAAWPPEVRAKWEEYRRVYETRKAEREAAAEAAARQGP